MHAKFSCDDVFDPQECCACPMHVAWKAKQCSVQEKTGSFHKCPGKIVAMPWLPISSEYELGEYENV